jgi:hypothetical protein
MQIWRHTFRTAFNHYHNATFTRIAVYKPDQVSQNAEFTCRSSEKHFLGRYMDFTWADHRSRTACAQSFAAKALRVEVTAAKPRKGGKFKKTVGKTLAPRTPAERAERSEEVVQARFDKYIQTRIAAAALLKEQSQRLQNLQDIIDKKNSQLVSLRLRLRLKGVAERVQPRPLQGGTSAPTQRRLASKLGSFLDSKYATIDARKKAIFEHSFKTLHCTKK